MNRTFYLTDLAYRIGTGDPVADLATEQDQRKVLALLASAGIKDPKAKSHPEPIAVGSGA